MRSLKGKRALLTGAASGIGRALALQLAAQGCNLLLVDRDKAGLRSIVDETRLAGVESGANVIDLANTAEFSQFLADLTSDKANSFDLLINNAGILHYSPTAVMTEEQMQRLLTVNLLVPIELTRVMLPRLLERPEAHIVNMSSMFGYVVVPQCAAYHASKFGLYGFSESLALEFSRMALGVTTVCPGFVSSKLFVNSPTGRRVNGTERRPPAWLCTSPERVASATIRGILRNKRLVIVSPLAYLAWYIHRFTPWLPAAVQWIRRRNHPRAAR